MTENIVKFYPKDAAKNPDHVLEQAIGDYEEVFIIGYLKTGEMDARASLNFQIEDIFFTIDAFKHKLLNGEYDTQRGDDDNE